jgi:hypothetical protein
MRLVLLVAGLAGCANDPIAEGTYSVALVRAENDTCGWPDDQLGIGTSVSVTVDWEDDVLVLAGLGADDTWEVFGDTYLAQYDEAGTLGNLCDRATTIEHALTPGEAGATFSVETHVTHGERGEGCTTIDNEFPCSHDLFRDGTRVGR